MLADTGDLWVVYLPWIGAAAAVAAYMIWERRQRRSGR
jgi:hypothetical protein